MGEEDDKSSLNFSRDFLEDSFRIARIKDLWGSQIFDITLEAQIRFGKPEIVNTDKGSQFSFRKFVDTLTYHGVKHNRSAQCQRLELLGLSVLVCSGKLPDNDGDIARTPINHYPQREQSIRIRSDQNQPNPRLRNSHMAHSTLCQLMLAFAALTLICHYPAQADEQMDAIRKRGRLKVAVYNNFPPYSEAGKGIDVELGQALAAKLGLQADVIGFMPGENMSDDLRNMVWRRKRFLGGLVSRGRFEW